MSRLDLARLYLALHRRWQCANGDERQRLQAAMARIVTLSPENYAQKLVVDDAC